MSVQTHNTKSIATIDLIFLHLVLYLWLGPPLSTIRIGTNLFKDAAPLGDRTEYGIKVCHVCMPNVSDDENMHYNITASEGLSSMIVWLHLSLAAWHVTCFLLESVNSYSDTFFGIITFNGFTSVF